MAEEVGKKLQALVQDLKWTYGIFWHHCSQQGTLIWRSGFYNGGIKTRKTISPEELSPEELSVQRTHQLQELYNSLLSAADSNQPARRPCAALLPEDLADTEWFYLLCMSFTFSFNEGLPGRALSKGDVIWLTRATEASSKIFKRVLLAKTAQIQTVVCISVDDGVVELGTIAHVEENPLVMDHFRRYFSPKSKPVCSEQSTSNQQHVINAKEASQQPNLKSPTVRRCKQPNAETNQMIMEALENPYDIPENHRFSTHNIAQESLLLHQNGSPIMHGNQWSLNQTEYANNINIPQISPTVFPNFLSASEAQLELGGGDAQYFNPPSGEVFQHQSKSSFYSEASKGSRAKRQRTEESAFSEWTGDCKINIGRKQNSMFKKILSIMTSPQIQRDVGSPSLTEVVDRTNVKASETEEHWPRDKLKDKFVVLHKLIPFVTKMDEASILDKAITYMKQLQQHAKGNDYTTMSKDLIPTALLEDEIESENNVELISLEEDVGSSELEMEATQMGSDFPTICVQVSLSSQESDAQVCISCNNRKDLLLDLLQTFKNMQLDIYSVQSRIVNSAFKGVLKAKIGDASIQKDMVQEMLMHTVIAQ